ncbi:MAG: periplasmic heavy metal sensor, partial [Candidatus Latescibacteria bacterium]|nr:periplasmic heavy metal sensor [Candidatus Latescibacterota bacterium]
MRTKIGFTLVALLVVGIVATAISQPMRGREKMPRTAGPEQGKGWMDITPALTTEQMEKISALRIDHQKATIDLRADLQKKRLDLRTLMMATKPNEKKINTVIEEMGA